MANFAQLDREMTQLREEMVQWHQEMQEQFRWILGLEILTWVTSLAMFLAALFRR